MNNHNLPNRGLCRSDIIAYLEELDFLGAKAKAAKGKGSDVILTLFYKSHGVEYVRDFTNLVNVDIPWKMVVQDWALRTLHKLFINFNGEQK